MAELILQKIDKEGTDKTYAACDVGGDTFNVRNNSFIHVINGDASSHVVTVVAVQDPLNTPEADAVDLPDIAVTVPDGEDRFIKIPPAYQVLGVANITYDDVTTQTIAAIYVG